MNPTENLSLRLSLCFVAAAGLAFASLSSEAPGRRTIQSMVEPSTIWDKSQIRVCWGKFSDLSRTAIERDQMSMLRKERFVALPQAERRAIQESIQSEYTLARTGIEFVGWEECRPREAVDAILVTAADRPEDWEVERATLSGASTIGHGGIYEPSKGFRAGRKNKPSYVFLSIARYNPEQKLSPIDALKITALHEFGHLAGLRHEHARRESSRDVNCVQMGTPLMQSEMRSRALTGVYDSNSVMSYCFIHSIKYRTGLKFQTKRTYAMADIPEMRRRRILGRGAISVVDPTISVVRELDSEYTDYQVRIGLSAGDVHALRCLYVYSNEERAKICVPTYDPIRAAVAEPSAR